ncbi:MAG: hypothetical protein IPM26_08935 [Saprospiraceae bacterium]|nr:hypothetical protein [Saprospiraceae bacterium]
MSSLKFFNDAEFTTLVKALEVLIETDGPPAISPKDAALRIDAMLYESNSPALDKVSEIFRLLEVAVPRFTGVFANFSKLDLNDRRKVLKKVIDSKGLLHSQFRDLSKALKVMYCIGY